MRLLPIALIALLPAALGAQAPSTLTARLGVDTISVEKMVRTGNTLVAEVVTRSPRTTMQRHRAQFDAAGNLTSLTVRDLDVAAGVERRTTTYTRHGDSLHISVRGDQVSDRMVAAP